MGCFASVLSYMGAAKQEQVLHAPKFCLQSSCSLLMVGKQPQVSSSKCLGVCVLVGLIRWSGHFGVSAGELASIPKARLEAAFGDSQAQWLYELAHGIDGDEVGCISRLKSRSASVVGSSLLAILD